MKTRNLTFPAITVLVLILCLAWIGVQVSHINHAKAVTGIDINRANDSGYDEYHIAYHPLSPLPSPQVGDSLENAAQSSWGEPSSRENITTSGGEAEYWYYDNGKMLYFKDGKLDLVVDNGQAE